MATYGGLTAAQWQELADAGFGSGGGTGLSAEAQFRQDHPSVAWIMDVSPEVKNLILHDFDKDTGEFDEQLFISKLWDTDWWKNTSFTARQWESLKETDPASAKQRINNRSYDISRQLGLPMNQGHKFHGISEVGYQLGLDDAQILEMAVNAIVSQQITGTRSGKGTGGGQALGGAGMAADEQVREAASQWMIKLTPQDQLNYTKHLITGRYTPEAMMASMEKRARQKWSHLSDQFDAGITAREFFSDHQQSIAQLMEVPTEQIDLLNDQRWQSVTTYDDGNGNIRPMSLAETERFVKSRDEWGTTKQAQEQGAAMAENIMRSFGKVK